MAKKNILVSFMRNPYGSIYFGEGLRAAVGIASGIDEHDVKIAFLSDGVFFCLKGASREETSMYIKTLSSMGIKMLVDRQSLSDRQISEEKVEDIFQIVPGEEILELYKWSDHNIDF